MRNSTPRKALSITTYSSSQGKIKLSPAVALKEMVHPGFETQLGIPPSARRPGALATFTYNHKIEV